MEDLMVFCNSTASIYEVSRSPTSNELMQPATPPLGEEDTQGPTDVDLDAEGYIHHFRDSSHQKIVSTQDIGSNTSVIGARSDDVTNNSGSKRNAAVNGSGSEADAGWYTVSSKGTFADAPKSLVVPRPCPEKSSEGSHVDQRLSNNANSAVDYAVIRSMVQTAPDPTIWGNKTMAKISTRPISGDTEEYNTSEDSDVSTISSVHGTINRHDSLSPQEANDANRVDMDANRENQGLKDSNDSGGHERKATPKAERSNEESNIQQHSRLSHRLEPEEDSLLAVSSISLFGVFRSKLTRTQSLYHEIFDLQHALREMKSRGRAAEQQLSETQSKMVGTFNAS